MTRRPRLIDGLRDGIEAARLPELGAGVGGALNRLAYGAEWMSRGRLVVPQPCTVEGCANGPFSSLPSLRRHLERAHHGLTYRQMTEACETARILSRKAVRRARGVR